MQLKKNKKHFFEDKTNKKTSLYSLHQHALSRCLSPRAAGARALARFCSLDEARGGGCDGSSQLQRTHHHRSSTSRSDDDDKGGGDEEERRRMLRVLFIFRRVFCSQGENECRRLLYSYKTKGERDKEQRKRKTRAELICFLIQLLKKKKKLTSSTLSLKKKKKNRPPSPPSPRPLPTSSSPSPPAPTRPPRSTPLLNQEEASRSPRSSSSWSSRPSSFTRCSHSIASLSTRRRRSATACSSSRRWSSWPTSCRSWPSTRGSTKSLV